MQDDLPNLLDELRAAVYERDAASDAEQRAVLDAAAQLLAEAIVNTLQVRDAADFGIDAQDAAPS